MKQEPLNKNSELHESVNMQSLPIYRDKLLSNLKTIAPALINIENKLNTLMDELQATYNIISQVK